VTLPEPVPLGRAETLLSTLAEALVSTDCGIHHIEQAGGVRRYEPLVMDLALVVVAPEPMPIVRVLQSLGHEVRGAGPSRLTMFARGGENVTVELTDEKNYALTLLQSTGTEGHLRKLWAHAQRSGWTLSKARLIQKQTRRELEPRTEADIYDALGLQFVAPELRHGDDEIEDAALGRLSDLVRIDQIRGDLHLHTSWSDGRDSLETMIHAARAIGYEYVAVTDHSQSSAATRVMLESDLDRQRAEIERLRKTVPDIAVLHGAEVDILPDDRLDFSDRALEGLDIVLASLHDSAGHSSASLTARYLAAIAHPLVNVITHPMNRIVGRYEGYTLDFDRICEAARATGTLLEVDGAPIHLDMDGSDARRAVRSGVEISISSDCHRASALARQMRFGVGTARRGGVGAARVVNTRPLTDVRALVARKRGNGRGPRP
jgi:DNA polymerase (family 10)